MTDSSIPKLPQAHFMIDLETLGLLPSSKILSVGLVQFTPEEGSIKEWYWELSLGLQTNRTVDPDTLEWWKSQGESMPCNGNISQANLQMGLAAAVQGEHEVMMWSRGPDFDIPLLRSFLHCELPWKYYRTRDLRTLLDICPVDIGPQKNKHNALADAQYQAAQAAAAMREIARWKEACCV